MEEKPGSMNNTNLDEVQRKPKARDSPTLLWIPEADSAWKEAKNIVANAVALLVPDWEGAADGSNSSSTTQTAPRMQ